MQSELLCSQGDALVWESHEHKKKKISEDGGERLLLACMPGVSNKMFLSPKGGPSPKLSLPM